MKIYRSAYKDIPAVTLESELLKAQFLPEYGGKLASLAYKKTCREFLEQAPGKEYKALEYDGSYVEAECSAFDDMFPTIDPCFYERAPWMGVRLPDHGEVCSLKWDHSLGEDFLYMSTYGVRLPYKLEKRICFEEDGLLRIDYKAYNLCNFDMDFIWAAHTMLHAEEGAEIEVPFENGSRVMCAFSSDPKFGGHGDSMTWPVAVRRDGGPQRLDRVLPMSPDGNNYKFFFSDKLTEGWFRYRFTSDGTVLTLIFPEDKVPYLGIWVNEGSLKGMYNIAPEPCTGAFDRLDTARRHNMHSILKPKEEYTWFLKFRVS